MMSLPLIAISALISPFVAPTASEPTSIVGGERVQENSTAGSPQEPGQVAPLEILDLDFADGISRAERLDKMLVVLWTGSTEARDAAHTKTVLGDPEVRRWISRHAIVTRLDRRENTAEARQNRIGSMQVPCIDIYSVRRRLRLERLTFGTEGFDFLAAVLGQTDGEVVTRPEGDDINEPFKWLAWANVRNGGKDKRAPEDALFAYQWCLQTADAIRPGFRARFLEYILRRITGLKNRTPAAKSALERERSRLKRRISDGKASRRDVYDYTRVFDWLSEEEDILTVFSELDSSVESQRQYQLWLLPAAAPVLGRYSSFEPLLQAVGDDAIEIFMARHRALEAEVKRLNALQSTGVAPQEEEPVGADGEPSAASNPDAPVGVSPEAAPAPTGPYDEEPLPYTITDSRSELLGDASWIFEALLSANRDQEARALQAAMAKCYPTAPRAYALFVERALRAKKWAIAAEVADLGMANVDEKAQKRLTRLQSKIEASTDK